MSSTDKFPPKDPSAVLDYRFDWAPKTNHSGFSDWLNAGELITSYSVTVPAGIVKDSDELTDNDTSVTVWISGGSDGVEYSIVNEVTTNQGRTDSRTVIIPVQVR